MMAHLDLKSSLIGSNISAKSGHSAGLKPHGYSVLDNKNKDYGYAV
jgi:hypothetical protein